MQPAQLCEFDTAPSRSSREEAVKQLMAQQLALACNAHDVEIGLPVQLLAQIARSCSLRMLWCRFTCTDCTASSTRGRACCNHVFASAIDALTIFFASSIDAFTILAMALARELRGMALCFGVEMLSKLPALHGDLLQSCADTSLRELM
jgi:hypothetical protein